MYLSASREKGTHSPAPSTHQPQKLVEPRKRVPEQVRNDSYCVSSGSHPVEKLFHATQPRAGFWIVIGFAGFEGVLELFKQGLLIF